MDKFDESICRQIFADRLHEARKSKGLTQRQAAKELGLMNDAFTLYENGHRLPSIPVLRKLSTLFECSTDWLLACNKRGGSDMKFIRTFDGRQLNLEQVQMLYVDERNRVCAVFRDMEIVIQKFHDEFNAQKWLDDTVAILNEEAPT